MARSSPTTLLVGVVGLAFTLRLLAWGVVELLWPLALIVVGALMIAGGLRRRR